MEIWLKELPLKYMASFHSSTPSCFNQNTNKKLQQSVVLKSTLVLQLPDTILQWMIKREIGLFVTDASV